MPLNEISSGNHTRPCHLMNLRSGAAAQLTSVNCWGIGNRLVVPAAGVESWRVSIDRFARCIFLAHEGEHRYHQRRLETPHLTLKHTFPGDLWTLALSMHKVPIPFSSRDKGPSSRARGASTCFSNAQVALASARGRPQPRGPITRIVHGHVGGEVFSGRFPAEFDPTDTAVADLTPGSYMPPTEYAAGQQPQRVAAGDLRGDGKQNLAVVTSELPSGAQPSISVIL